MKKLLTILILALTLTSAQAKHHSALKLKMFDNGVFSVVLDETPSCQPSGFFSDNSVQPGYHKLKVIRYTRNPFSPYPVKQVVYKGWISIPPRSVVFASINCHNQFEIEKIIPRHPSHKGGAHGNGWGEGGCEYGNDCGDEQGEWGSVSPPVCPMPVCIEHAAFLQLKKMMSASDFDNSRFVIAQQALSYNYFTAAQVADLSRMFSFESSRLEFAKLAFGKTIDKQNYFMVSEAFTFPSSVGELNEYIAKR